MHEYAQRLIRTKLYRPLLPRETIRRQHLLDLLDEGSDQPLTLITAPAGSGKTTLLCDWLSAYPGPNVWLSLDEKEGDLEVFLSYFVAAIQTVFPDACNTLAAMLQAPEPLPQHIVATTLINELDSLRSEPALAGGRRLVVVLDDYHLLHSPAIDELIIALLRHPTPVLRIVLASRSDPALPLSMLRARRHLLEIRFHQLRFTLEETTAFLRQVLDRPLPAEITSALQEHTEGWITGLHLASLYVKHAPSATALLADIQASDRYALDYLVDEVLALLPPLIQEFLLKTAILDRLCASLVEAVVGLDDEVCNGQAYLKWLERANLFVFVLDDPWYRCHHLFQQLLLNRLHQQFSADEIASLHSRASAWFAGHGLIDEAIAHALQAGNEAAAVQIIETHRHEAMNQEQWQYLDRWLHLLPARLIDQRPELLLLEAWVLQKQWRLFEIAPLLDRIEAHMAALPASDPASSYQQGEVYALRSLVCYYRLESEATFTFARCALEHLPMACSSVRGLAWMYLAAGRQVQGDIAGAHAALNDGLQEDRIHRNAFPARPLMALCFLNWLTADLDGLSQTATRFLRIATERNLAESIWWARYFRGCAAYQAGDLAAAEDDFAAVVDQRYVAHSLPFTQSAFGLAMIWQAQGAGDRAQALVESVLTYGREIDNARVLSDTRAFQAWLALEQGRQAEALRWARTVDPDALMVPMTTFHVGLISLARILVSAKSPASLERAAELLARLRNLVESSGDTRGKIEVLALQALLVSALGREQAALVILREAVALAQPGGVVRVFVDLGPSLARLLERLVQQGGAPEHAARLLQAMGASPAVVAVPVGPLPPKESLIEPLTYREQEVLELLAQRLSAKEIAQQLIISDRTVKRHTANIYQKLAVNNRQQAVDAAKALGILAFRR